MSRWDIVRIKNSEGMSDSELKEEVQHYPNGAYVVEICRRCGGYKTALEGNTQDAKMVDVCSFCINKTP